MKMKSSQRVSRRFIKSVFYFRENPVRFQLYIQYSVVDFLLMSSVFGRAGERESL